jgi:hypothetical protein
VDIVLGVSMTPTTVRMVLVEGEKADGVTVDHDVFDIHTPDGSATSGAAEQVAAAVLGTQESAAASGHHLKSIGVTWTHHSDAAALRDIMEARGIEDVMFVSATHAAASLAQAVGRAIGYDTTALLFIEKDTATLSVVQTEDGSVVKMLSRDLHDSDAMAVLTEMAKSVESAESSPQGMFIVGSGVDASAVKAHLENLVTLPVSAPDEPELALARGAALASAHAPEMEASTAGLAYSQDHDGTTAASAYPELVGAATQMAGVATQMAGVATQMAPAGGGEAYSDALAYSDELDELAPEPEQPYEDESRKPFLLVGSALTSIFVVGVVALVISLAVSIRPTVDQRPSPGETPVIPSQAAPDPVQRLAPAAPAPAPAPAAPAAPPPEIIKAPVPVVQQAPAQAPRTVFVEQPAPAPAAALPAPPPVAPPEPVLPAPPVAVPAAPVVPPVLSPPVYNPPAYYPQRPPVYYPPRPPVWVPPWQPSQQIPDDPPVQQPQYPQYPGSGSGSGGYPGSRNSGSDGYPGYPGSGSGRYGDGGSGSRGGSGGGQCFLIFCRR